MTHINKKGITKESLILLLLAAALVIALLLLAKGTAFALTKQSDVQICRTTAIQGSWSLDGKFLAYTHTFVDSPIRLNCKTQYVDLKGDKILFGDHSIKLGDNRNDNTNILKKLVMDQLSECWYQFGDGRTGVQKTTNERSACVICSELIPDKDFIKDYGSLELKNLYSYARNNEGDYGSNKKYRDYLTADGFYDAVPSSIDNSRKIQFNQPYFTVFQVVNDDIGGNKDSAVVDCFINGIRETGSDGNKIGCDNNGELDGVNFGTVLDGGTLTVRMVPASGITAANCERLI